MKPSDLRKRIRQYEDSYKSYLTKRTPVIIRVDGKAFSSFTKYAGFSKPFDKLFMSIMNETARDLCAEIQGAKIAYVQSDEITVLLIDYDRYNTESWFGKSLQKMCSVSASIATASFNFHMFELTDSSLTRAQFDSRVFCVPREEVCNVFIDRQKDCLRNSALSLGQSVIGRKEILGLSCEQIIERLPIEWENLDEGFKFGRIIMEGEVLNATNVFAENRNTIDHYVWPDEEEGSYSISYTMRDYRSASAVAKRLGFKPHS
jgi:hypothetical protein